MKRLAFAAITLLFSGSAAAKSQIEIIEVIPDYDRGEIHVVGKEFGKGELPKAILGGIEIVIVEFSDSFISGEFDFTALPAGDYTLEIESENSGQPATALVTLGAAGPTGPKGDKGDKATKATKATPVRKDLRAFPDMKSSSLR